MRKVGNIGVLMSSCPMLEEETCGLGFIVFIYRFLSRGHVTWGQHCRFRVRLLYPGRRLAGYFVARRRAFLRISHRRGGWFTTFVVDVSTRQGRAILFWVVVERELLTNPEEADVDATEGVSSRGIDPIPKPLKRTRSVLRVRAFCSCELC